MPCSRRFSSHAVYRSLRTLEESAPVVLVSYAHSWPAQFETIKQQLLTVFPLENCTIEHIGSTAVRGMAAKPIIDIMLGALDLPAIEAKVDRLAVLGFHYVPELNAAMPMRRYFVLPASRPRIAHLHAVVRGDAFWRDHLLFRNVLRSDSGLASVYAALKYDLAKKFANDSFAYAAAKTSFVQAALNHARMPAKQ